MWLAGPVTPSPLVLVRVIFMRVTFFLQGGDRGKYAFLATRFVGSLHVGDAASWLF